MAPPPETKRRLSCKWKDDLVLSHGLQRPANGISTCTFCLSFGREVRVPAAENQNAGKRKPIMRPLAFTDFSRSRIEEHYVMSHPAKWREYKRKLESKGRSDATNSEFFNSNKLTSHFRRVQNDGVLKNVSRSVGDLIRSLQRARPCSRLKYRRIETNLYTS
jgi:hypothetical protein